MSNLIQILNKQLIEDVTSKPSRRREKVFWPSDASIIIRAPFGNRVEGTCLRKLYYDYTLESFTNVTNTKYNLIHKAGKAWEVEILDTLRKSKDIKVLSTNEKFEHDLGDFIISGEFDLVVEDGGIIYGADIKSTKGDYYDTKEVISGSPKLDNVLQMMIYLDYVNKKRPEFSNLWKILYFGRGNGESSEHEISLTEDGFACINGFIEKTINIKDIYDRFRLLSEFISLGAPPPRDYSIEWDQEYLDKRYKEDSSFKPAYYYYKLSKTSMGKADRGEIMGSAMCQLLCPYRDKCWENSIISQV